MNVWLEDGYRYLPVWAQNLALTAFGIPYRSHRLGGNFEKYVREFRIRDRWTAEQLNGYLERQLHWTLEEAYHHVPHYQLLWRSHGVSLRDLQRITLDAFTQLPITSKEDLRAHPDEFLSGKRIRREKTYSNASSGSTGTPIRAVWSSDVRRKCMAAREVRSFGWAGSSIRNPRAMIGGRPIVHDPQCRGPFYRYNCIEHQVYFSAYHLSPDNARNYVEGFRKYKPRVLTGYAHCYYFLARHMLEQALDLGYKPTALILSSEPASEEMRSVIRQAFHARAFEEYSSVENCFLVTECECGNLHVSSDFGILEIVDDQGRPVPPGTPGRVLATGFLNPIQPLIRYQVGDLASWASRRCSCGRDHFPVLEGVQGRLEDVIVGPDGREMVRFHSLFLNLSGLVEAQVIQENIDQLRIRVVTTTGFGTGEEESIRQRAVSKLGAQVKVIVERVASIPRNSRGKFRSVVSLLSEEEKREARVAQL